MINYKNLYAGAAVLNEFKEKLKALCDEYTKRRDEACPENIASGLWDKDCQTVKSIRLQFVMEGNRAARAALIAEGFVYKSSSDTRDRYTRQIGGINVICHFENNSDAEDSAAHIGRIMKNLYVGVMVLNEFKEKLKALCDEYTKKRDEACPENYVGRLWNERDQNVESIWIQFPAEESGVTAEELADEGFVYTSSSDISDFYEKEIDGIRIVCSDRKKQSSKETEALRIISSLRAKYPIEDVIDILKAARLKANNLMYCKDCLATKETDGPPIDESDLPF